MKRIDVSCLGFLAALLATSIGARADVSVPSIFGDHMVFQRNQSNPVWGWADPGESVTVAIAGQERAATAGNDGRWELELDSMPAGGPHTLRISGANELEFTDVLVGEVWLCSGQSNMQYPVNSANDADLEKLAANFPKIRLITVPQVGVQEPQKDFKGAWQPCAPETVGDFSAVGYFFGRQLLQTLDVPIGLIDNSWGGSSAEAWVDRDRLRADERYAPLLERWRETERTYDPAKAAADYENALKKWEAEAKAARDAGRQPPSRPRRPSNPLTNQHRPGNLYNGVLKPIIGFGIRGVIWYQGESNAGRAYQYRHLFPLMIQNWRDEWDQGDFPFYWVQLADFRDEKSEPADSAWAELREAQTMTLDRLPNTGEAVILDLGEAHDIHPKNKQDVAKRLVRWALARDYGLDIVYRSPRYESMKREGDKLVLTFEHVGGGLDTFDVRQPIGFTVAGNDKRFVPAQARIIDENHVEVWSDQVPEPVAARYAWADNPVCNLQNREGLRVTPFRTDDWPGVTDGKN